MFINEIYYKILIRAPRSAKPWISGNKLSCKGTISPGPMEAVFFGSQVVNSAKCAGGITGRLSHARQVYINCLIEVNNINQKLIL